jgi:hypothetical protein
MIELLESRIAPAAILTYTEVDGDKVKVKTSKGTTAQLETAIDFGNHEVNIDGITLDLVRTASLAAAFADTNVTIKVIETGDGDGDGVANSVVINAFDPVGDGIDLGKVKVAGNVFSIDAGDGDLSASSKAIESLTVTRFITPNEGPIVAVSRINGDIGTMLVKDSFAGYLLSQQTFNGGDGTRIGSLTVNGRVGQGGDNVGHVQVGSIGKLVLGTLTGSSADSDENGTPDVDSGVIEAVSLGKVKVGEITGLGELRTVGLIN